MSLATAFTRVYMMSAKTAHLVLADTAVSVAPRALCRIRPYQEKSRFGTGSQAEYERAAALPLCARCAAVAESAELPAAGTAQPAAGTEPAASSSTLDGAAAERAIEEVPPASLSRAPEAHPPALGASGSPSATMRPRHGEDDPDSSPPAGARPDDAPAGGSTPLAGEEWRKAAKAARSEQAKARRNGRGRYPVRRPGDGNAPGMIRRLPPGGGAP